jgi:hypothetical protein
MPKSKHTRKGKRRPRERVDHSAPPGVIEICPDGCCPDVYHPDMPPSVAGQGFEVHDVSADYSRSESGYAVEVCSEAGTSRGQASDLIAAQEVAMTFIEAHSDELGACRSLHMLDGDPGAFTRAWLAAGGAFPFPERPGSVSMPIFP